MVFFKDVGQRGFKLKKTSKAKLKEMDTLDGSMQDLIRVVEAEDLNAIRKLKFEYKSLVEEQQDGVRSLENQYATLGDHLCALFTY